MRAIIVALVLMAFLVPALQAAHVAVVADDGSSVRTACVSYTGTATAETILSSSGLGVELADFGEMGKAVCKIGATGCPASNCFCDPNWSYWAFYYSSDGTDWTLSEVGISAHDVHDGEVLGFSWTAFPPTAPSSRTYSDICGNAVGGEAGQRDLKHFTLSFSNQTLCAGSPFTLNISCEEDEAPAWTPSFDFPTRRLLSGAAVDVFYKKIWWNLLEQAETNRSGQLELAPERAGNYSLELRKESYIPLSADFEVFNCPILECLSDSECEYDMYCDAIGSCRNVSGACGYAENHRFIEYACCSDSACGANMRCEDHRCTQKDDARMREIVRVMFNYYI